MPGGMSDPYFPPPCREYPCSYGRAVTGQSLGLSAHGGAWGDSYVGVKDEVMWKRSASVAAHERGSSAQKHD